MRKIQGQRLLFQIMIALAVIGVLNMIFSNPGRALIPILVFGGIFLLYKYPPHRWRSLLAQARSRFGSSYGESRDYRRTKRAKFRVIPGTKKDDDDTPKYH